MNRIIAAILVLAFVHGSFAQIANPSRVALTIADLESRDPVPYERVQVIHGSSDVVWDNPRTFIHDPFSVATPIPGYVVTNRANSGRYVASDRWAWDHNIKNFLAVGNGIADDTAAFEAAPLVVTYGKQLEIPSGVYNVTRELALPADYVTYYGHGYASDIRVAHNGNAFAHYGVLSGQPRRSGVQFKDLRFTVAAGYYPSNALYLGDVSYSIFERIFVTGGAAPGFASAVYTYGNYSIPDAIWGGNWGNKFVDCEFYNRPGTNWIFFGSGGPGGTGGPNDLRLIDCYFGGGLGGARTNGATGAIWLENCNMVRISGNDIEQFSTNAIGVGTNATEIIIERNRFEHQGGLLDVRSLVQVGSNSVVTFRDNMSRDQGGVLQKFRTDSFPGTIMDTTIPINQWYSQNVIFGIEPSFNSANYEPLAAFTKLSLMTKHADYTNALVIGNFDGVHNPRLVISNEGTNRTVINSGSSIQSIPLYIVGSDTYAKFGISEASILGEGVGSAGRPGGGSGAFTVNGGIFGGREPRDSFVEGYTTMTHGAYMRTYYPDDVIGFFSQIVDNSTNRRVELSVRYDRVQLRDGYTLGAGLIEVISGQKTNLVVRDSGVEVRTNALFTSPITLETAAEPNTPTNAASFWLADAVAKEIALKWQDASISRVWHSGNHGSGSGLDADLLDGRDGSWYLARSNHVGPVPWTLITNTPTTLAGYGITDAVWTATNDGAGSGLDADLLDGQHGSFYLVRSNQTGKLEWTEITNTPTTLAGYGITDGPFLPLSAGIDQKITGDIQMSNSVASPRILFRTSDTNGMSIKNEGESLTFYVTSPSYPYADAKAVLRIETNGIVSFIRPPRASGSTYGYLTAAMGHASGTNPATASTRNYIPVISFDPTVVQQYRWTWQIPNGFNSGALAGADSMIFTLHWTTSATAGDARWIVKMQRLTGEDIDSDSFGGGGGVITTASATAGTVVTSSTGSVGLDSAVGGDFVEIKVERDVSHATDTIDADAIELIGIEIRNW